MDLSYPYWCSELQNVSLCNVGLAMKIGGRLLIRALPRLCGFGIDAFLDGTPDPDRWKLLDCNQIDSDIEDGNGDRAESLRYWCRHRGWVLNGE